MFETYSVDFGLEDAHLNEKNLPQRNIDHGEVVVLVDDRLKPWVEGVGHDLEAGPDAGDNQVDVVTRAAVRAEPL